MSNNDQQWPTGVPRADIEGLCKQLDYTFVDIPDLVYSGDEDDVEMSDSSTTPHCSSSVKLAPAQHPWERSGGSGVPPQPSARYGAAVPAPGFSNWRASQTPGHQPSSPGMVRPDFAPHPQPHGPGAVLPGPQQGAPAAVAAACGSAPTDLALPARPQDQPQPQQPQLPALLLPPGAAWGPEHLRLLQQRPHPLQPGVYAASGPHPAAGGSGFTSPAGS
ncbi:hypothetical protein HYH02_002707 [Chlamydomonas schloesseri]|uniref:Uncharacterized protein n=1 Tax=Chlamydomonas schloesseri TaxID=2026947 RepID=A0A836BA96_9CHLO|nr:hypothetical protein HYH02_002707 [Chlamydomonas schloesseri]|eukprot:KAG2452467.1 hypothetical protein HYH02_002707 [Chlamydomonas schloesseri]